MHTPLLRIAIVAVLAGGVTAAVTVAQEGGNPDAAKLENPVAATPDSIAAGEKLYMRRCRGCHGSDATGGPPKEAGGAPTSNLVDDQYQHGSTDGEIYWVIRNGIPPELVMEPFDDRLDETDSWHIVNYLRSLQGK